MCIFLDNFDEIINPQYQLVASPRTATTVQVLMASADERQRLQNSINALHDQAGQVTGFDELKRRATLLDLQKQLDSYPRLAQQPASYIQDTDTPPAAMRHGKDRHVW